MRHRASHQLTPHRWASVGTTGEGLLRPSGNRVLGGHCSRPRALSPETDYAGHRGTEYSGATVHGPEHSPGTWLFGSSGNRVLGGHCLQPRAVSSQYLVFSGHRGARVLRGPLFVAPSTLSRNLVFSDFGEITPEGGRHVALCCSGLGTRGPPVSVSPTACMTR